MNPPYDRGLHLKFLDKISKLGDNVVSIQLINKFQDAVKKEECLPISITSIELINQTDANDIFNIKVRGDCGIIFIDYNKNNDYKNFTNIINYYTIYNKIKTKTFDILWDHTENKISTEYPLKYYYGCGWDYTTKYDGTSYIYNTVIIPEFNDYNHIKFICCQSDQERINLFKYGFTAFFKFCVKIGGSMFVPYMKDYTKQWTDKDLYGYFDITPDEQKIIENEVKDYLCDYKI